MTRGPADASPHARGRSPRARTGRADRPGPSRRPQARTSIAGKPAEPAGGGGRRRRCHSAGVRAGLQHGSPRPTARAGCHTRQASAPSTPQAPPVTASTGSGRQHREHAFGCRCEQPARRARRRGARRREKETTWSRLASDVVAAAELAEELEDDLEALRRELIDSRKAQRRAEQERDEAVEARFTARTVLEALTLAEACFPDRLVVLPSARASADSSPFRDPARIFESLSLLAFFGRHDGDFEAILQKVMGVQARWRPTGQPRDHRALRRPADLGRPRRQAQAVPPPHHRRPRRRRPALRPDLLRHRQRRPRRARVGRRAPADHQRGHLIPARRSSDARAGPGRGRRPRVPRA
jgi:hypothetical protein